MPRMKWIVHWLLSPRVNRTRQQRPALEETAVRYLYGPPFSVLNEGSLILGGALDHAEQIPGIIRIGQQIQDLKMTGFG